MHCLPKCSSYDSWINLSDKKYFSPLSVRSFFTNSMNECTKQNFSSEKFSVFKISLLALLWCWATIKYFLVFLFYKTPFFCLPPVRYFNKFFKLDQWKPVCFWLFDMTVFVTGTPQCPGEISIVKRIKTKEKNLYQQFTKCVSYIYMFWKRRKKCDHKGTLYSVVCEIRFRCIRLDVSKWMNIIKQYRVSQCIVKVRVNDNVTRVGPNMVDMKMMGYDQ